MTMTRITNIALALVAIAGVSTFASASFDESIIDQINGDNSILPDHDIGGGEGELSFYFDVGGDDSFEGGSGNIVAVPEPATLGLIAAAAIAGLRRR